MYWILFPFRNLLFLFDENKWWIVSCLLLLTPYSLLSKIARSDHDYFYHLRSEMTCLNFECTIPYAHFWLMFRRKIQKYYSKGREGKELFLVLKSQVNFCQNAEAPYKQKTAWKILQPNICYSEIIQSGSSIHFLSLWAWVGEVLNSIQFYLLGCDHSVRHAFWEKGESFQISQDFPPTHNSSSL